MNKYITPYDYKAYIDLVHCLEQCEVRYYTSNDHDSVILPPETVKMIKHMKDYSDINYYTCYTLDELHNKYINNRSLIYIFAMLKKIGELYEI